MNRMVFHNCPVHTEDDLVETAEAIVASYAHKGGVNQVLSARYVVVSCVPFSTTVLLEEFVFLVLYTPNNLCSFHPKLLTFVLAQLDGIILTIEITEAILASKRLKPFVNSCVCVPRPKIERRASPTYTEKYLKRRDVVCGGVTGGGAKAQRRALSCMTECTNNHFCVLVSAGTGTTISLQRFLIRICSFSFSSLPIIAQVYHRINEEQPYQNFFGSREFYSIVQFLSRALQGPRAKEAEMSDDLLLMAFLRNFGGLPPEVPSLVRAWCFVNVL